MQFRLVEPIRPGERLAWFYEEGTLCVAQFGGTRSIDGAEIENVGGLLDVDLGFTPATNTNAIRRLGLAIGEEVETTAVWLDTEDWGFKPLKQVYRRLSKTEFAYASPSHDYAAILITDDFGIVRSYPQLWAAVSGLGLSKN